MLLQRCLRRAMSAHAGTAPGLRFGRAASTAAQQGQDEKPLVGYVGLGNMGWGMAMAVVKAGLPVVVWTRAPGKAESFVAAASKEGEEAGHGPGLASAAASPRTVAGMCDVTMTCLANEAAGAEVYTGAQGILAGLAKPLQPPQQGSTSAQAHDRCRGELPRFLPRWPSKDRIVMDHSTVGVDTSLDMRQQVEAAGACFLDAPVSGTPQRALDGDLTLMVGGGEDVIARCQPVLEAVSSHVEHMGGPGAGAGMKLVNQLLASVQAVATCEALALARALDIKDTAQVLRVVETSSGRSLAFSRGAALLAQFEEQHGRDAGLSELIRAPTGVPLRLLRKDAGLCARTAQEAQLPVTQAAVSVFDKAAEVGHTEADVMAVLQVLEQYMGGAKR